MSVFPRWVTKSTHRYELLTRLTAPSGSVHALAISNDGRVLACGGEHASLRVQGRALINKQAPGVSNFGISIPGKNFPVRLAITNPEERLAVRPGSWLGQPPRRPSVTEQSGSSVKLPLTIRKKSFQEICARRLGSGFEITCVSWDSTSSGANTRIAVGMRDKMVQVLVLNANSQLQSVFAVRLDNTVPKSVAFADNQDVYVFGLYDGNFIKLGAEDGTVGREFSCKSVIGHAAVNQKRSLFVVDNATDGFTLYRLENEGEDPIRTFTTAVPIVSVPKQVAFGEEGKMVAGGSDNGSVYVFDRKTGKLLDTLHHADGGLVQTIATRDINGRCTIASASPAQGRGSAMIKLWTYDYAPRKASNTPSKDYWSLLRVLMVLTQVVILLSMSVFLMVNYKDGFFDKTVAWSVDQVHHYTTPMTTAKAADDFTRRAMYEYLKVEGRKEGHPNNDIAMLRELAGKFMELAIEAGGDLNEVEHQEEVAPNN